MYLIDTNIWLERLLGQAKSDEVGQFLDQIPSNQLFITDFAFHSICVILTRLKRKAALLDFVQDVFANGAVTLVSIKPGETQSLVDMMDKFNLDFDDAYQYVAAEQNDLIIVSFDGDLDGTTRGKKTPAEILMAQKATDVE
jgi:uncharacterized protein